MPAETRSLQSRAKAEAGTAIRFAIVGGLATLTHAAVAVLLFETDLLPALIANLAGFLVAFGVSFAGHHFWSFSATRHNGGTGKRMRRFFILAVTGFALNSSVLASWIGLTNWPETLGILFSIAIVPALTFLGARLWAFSGPAAP
ncbi:GtrA family protein [Roseibium sp.]|uniref:GtrA family protein n=1 Tax=Roseibium sp. TaxID=1936156 RepID=UPI003A9737C8